MDHDMSVGQRIRYWRKRRGIEVAVLANLVGRSTSWLEKVERGERTCERVSILLALANVLKIGLGDLIGGISLPPNGGQPLDPPKGTQAIRRALFTLPTADREPPTVADVRRRAHNLGILQYRGSYEAEAVLLPEVLTAGRAAAAHELPGAWWELARLYRWASSLLRRIGELDLALLAADRAVSAAVRAEDPWMVALSQRQVAFAQMREGWLDDSGATCSNAADAITPTATTSLEGWSMWGSLRLTEAVAAARKADAAQAWRVLREARQAADVVGPGRNDYEQCFGPANVSAHEVAVALELGDPIQALRAANSIDIEELGNSLRRADVLIDVAQAHSLRQNDLDTVGALLAAEKCAPQVVRYSVKAHEMVRVCIKRERKTLTPDLRPLAERLKVTV